MPSDRDTATNRLPLTYAALGLLMAGPRHGYELHNEFTEQFGTIWRAGRSQFYAALKSLETEALVESVVVEQEKRPSRKILTLAPAGREAFLAWLAMPISHIREIRVEFLAKLHFHRILALPDAVALIDAQSNVCRDRLQRLKEELDAPTSQCDPFCELVYDFRRRQIGAIIDWLEECRRRYA